MFNRWGDLITPDSSDYSPIKKNLSSGVVGWWDVGASGMLRSARRELSERSHRDRPMPLWEDLGYPIWVAVPGPAGRAGRQAWQVAFRPPAGWAGPPMIWWCFWVLGRGGRGGQVAAKHRSVRKSQSGYCQSCASVRSGSGRGIPSCGPSCREVWRYNISAATPERQSNGRMHDQPSA